MPGNQVAGEDEKHVDTNKAAGQPHGKGVKDDHREHGNGMQAVDIRSIARSCLDQVFVQTALHTHARCNYVGG